MNTKRSLEIEAEFHVRQATAPCNKRGAIYRHEVKKFIQQQVLMGLTTKEIKEKCNARFPEYDFSDQKIRDFIRNNRIKRVKPEKNDRILTMEESDFAENNINIVYDYLHKNRLEIDEWFDIVVFGYLHAVIDYCRKKELKQYAFTTIAWNDMRSEISNYRTRNQALKRAYEIISFDAVRTEGGAGLDEVIPNISAEEQYQKTEFSHDMQQMILKKLNKEQQRQLYLLYCEYKPGEIADLFKISKERQRKNKAYMQIIFSKSGLLPLHRCNYAESLLAATRQAQN